MRKSVILKANSASSLLDEFNKWQANNQDARNAEIHYSHSVAYPVDIHKSAYAPYESHAMLILFTEAEKFHVSG